jgi:hypothetical protein
MTGQTQKLASPQLDKSAWSYKCERKQTGDTPPPSTSATEINEHLHCSVFFLLLLLTSFFDRRTHADVGAFTTPRREIYLCILLCCCRPRRKAKKGEGRGVIKLEKRKTYFVVADVSELILCQTLISAVRKHAAVRCATAFFPCCSFVLSASLLRRVALTFFTTRYHRSIDREGQERSPERGRVSRG